MNHLWQRFLLTSSLLIGLVVGVTATVFGYSNLTSVDIHWSVFHINGVPLWTVAVVPLAITLAAGTLYHWMDGLHHFTEHMRHRRRVHELEAEVASLRAHLDQLLEMPDHSSLPAKRAAKVSLPPAPEESEQTPQPAPVEALPEPVAIQAEAVPPTPEPLMAKQAPAATVRKPGGERRKRVRVTVTSDPVAGRANGEDANPTPTPIKPNPGA